MFYGQCNKCGERWSLGTPSTCTCPDLVTWDATAPIVTIPHPAFKKPWVGLTDEDWKQLWDEFDSLDIENDFQDHMVGKYGEGYYTDADMYWQFQQQTIKQMVNAKLEEKNSG